MKTIYNLSKILSLALRHKPEVLGLELDKNGWASTEDVIVGLRSKGKVANIEVIRKVVNENNKKRFSLNETGTKIRANQGHSINVDVELKIGEPPITLYHGTVEKFIDLILNEGLKKMSRQHVHLSQETSTATNVGNRRGKAIILEVEAQKMIKDGYKFYLSENNVWLTDYVPAKYIKRGK